MRYFVVPVEMILSFFSSLMRREELNQRGM